MKEMNFICDICKKRKPFAEVYPYTIRKTKEGYELDIKFRGIWSYCCLKCFIFLKILEKFHLTKYKFAWVKTDEHNFRLMMSELGDMRDG